MNSNEKSVDTQHANSFNYNCFFDIKLSGKHVNINFHYKPSIN